jgi:hypothetical protein
MKVSELKNLIENVISKEVRNKIISESKEVYHIKCEGVPLGTFDTEEEANEALPSYKAKHDGELIIEKGQYDSHESMIDKLDEMNDELEETENMENTQMNEYGNRQDPYEYYDEIIEDVKAKVDEWLNNGKIDEQEHYEMYFKIDSSDVEWNHDRGGNKTKHILIQLAKECAPHLLKKKKKEEEIDEKLVGKQKNIDKNDNGKIDAEDFKILNKEEEECKECGDTEMKEGTCEKCGKELCECGSGMYESKKKRTIRISESELTKLIAKMVNESIPGLDAVKSAHDGDKETKKHLSDLENIMNKSASFDGNDNPEFPKPIGKGEKVARQNTEKENEYVEDTRGGTLLNLEYNTEPSDQFKDRLKKALEGDASTGNSQEYANVIKSDTGKNLAKQAERKKKKEDAEFSVSWGHSWKSPEEVKVVNETTFKMSDVLEEEIKKMKDMVNYNKKTQ